MITVEDGSRREKQMIIPQEKFYRWLMKDVWLLLVSRLFLDVCILHDRMAINYLTDTILLRKT